MSPSNAAYTADELAFQLKDSGASAIATQMPFLQTALKAAKTVGIPDERVILIGDQKDSSYKFKHFTSVRNLAGTSRFRKSKINVDKDLAFLPYSSGTTGKPKGVMLCHRNITSNTLQNYANEHRWLSPTGGKNGQGDKVLGFLPFFHIYGLTVLIHLAFYMGLELVVMPKFDMERYCQIVQEHRITMVFVAPPVVLAMGKSPIVDKYDLQSIRMLNSGAAPLTSELVESVWKRLRIPTKQGYGLSETSPTTHAQPWDRWETAMGSAGILLPNQIAKFMSAEEKEVPIGETGELWLKGPNVFMGYLNNKEGTANCLTTDGFFKTGDVGYQDKDGNFYITDRVKELIKVKGFQVPPAELEGKMLAHPNIDDVCVIGVYSKEEATEVPRAYVVAKNKESVGAKDAKDIQDWVASKVAHYKRLKGGVFFIDEIPKSASGKILRRVLKEQALKDSRPSKL